MAIDFTPANTNHPGNVERLKGQNKKLYDWLAAGNNIHVFHDAMRTLRIGHLHSRISDLRNKCHLVIYSRPISIDGCHCNEYSLKPFSI